MSIFFKIWNILFTSKIEEPDLIPDFQEKISKDKEEYIEKLNKSFRIPDVDDKSTQIPLEGDVFYSAGFDSFIQGCYKDAAELFTKAITRNPEDYRAYFCRALSRLNIGDKQGCLLDLTKTINIKPDYSDAYTHISDIYIAEHEYNRAIRKLEEGIKYGAINHSIYYSIGFSYMKLNEYEASLINLKKSNELNDRLKETHLLMGIVYGELKKRVEAIKSYDIAIELDEEYALAYYGRASEKLLLGDKIGALKDFVIAASLGDEDANKILKNWNY